MSLEPPPTPARHHDARDARTATLPGSPTTPRAVTSDSKLMPPPLARPQQPTPTSLRVPPTSSQPQPNRLAPATSNSPRPTGSFGAASTSTLSPAARARNKVVLSPGHSPLDWAALMQTAPARELSGAPFPARITPSQLAAHTGRRGTPAWSAYKGKVYHIAPYLAFHPGGEGQLLRAAGRDGTRLFEEVHPWVNWEGMMGPCLVGFLVPEPGPGEGDEDEMEAQD